MHVTQAVKSQGYGIASVTQREDKFYEARKIFERTS